MCIGQNIYNEIILLISQKNILEFKQPFLLVHPAADWLVVIVISNAVNGLKLTILEEADNTFKKREINIYTVPFYVGADIWELDYGTVLMGLNHSTLVDHPAINLWKRWKLAK